jgi:hypothetical protein
MADEAFDGVCFAVGVQTALGTVNDTIAALSGVIDETDGCVLGVLDAGDAKSGVTLPTMTRVGTEKAELANFTRQPTTFLRTDISGLSITTEMKGEGGDSGAPDAGACKPLAGMDVLWESLCLEGANGAAPIYVYTPATGVTNKYLTIKLWAGDQSWVFMDALAGATIELTPGGIGVVTFNFEVGSLNAQADAVAFPTVTYGTMSTLSAPVVQTPTTDDTHEWPDGTAKGFNTYSLSINTSLEKTPDSNQATGERIILAGREIALSQRTWILAADTDFEYEELIRTTISTSAIATQVGDIVGASGTCNAYKIELLEPEVTSLKYDRLGTALVVDSVVEARSDAAGGDFKLTFN